MLSLLLSTSFVQTKLGAYVTEKVNADFGANLSVGKVNLSFLGSVFLKDIHIKDHHKDTLIVVKTLKTSLLSAKKVIDGNVLLSDVTLQDGFFYMKTYKDEQKSNLTVFLEKFKTDKPKDSLKKFILKTDNAYLHNLDFKLINQNKSNATIFSATGIGGNIQQLAIIGANTALNARGLYFKTNTQLNVVNLTTDFKYTLKSMAFNNTTLKTPRSLINADVLLKYNKNGLAGFNNKVFFNSVIKKSTLSLIDLKHFYNPIQGNDVVTFSGNLRGPLNNFNLSNLSVNSRQGLRFYGGLYFRNVLNPKNGVHFKSDIKRFVTTASYLKRTLPSVLNKNLPKELEALGVFNAIGRVGVTPTNVDASVTLASEIGNITTDLTINNVKSVNKAAYVGAVAFKEFNVGKLFNDPLFGKVSLQGNVKGSGFALDKIDTQFIGSVSALNFKGYTYKNISVNGQYQNNKFDGNLDIKDTNFKMNFNGLADLSSKIHTFDFKSDIAYLDLNKTNLFTRDSTAIVKGTVRIDVKGNSFDNILGAATFKDVLYTNPVKDYAFKEFTITSSIKDSIKKITLDSKDIINGEIYGKFYFSQLPKVVQNALGSIYTNYSPYEVTNNQFLNFNLSVYNKIVAAFFPKVNIGNNTKLRGVINSDKDLFRLNFESPKINAFGAVIEDVVLRTDTKGTLYNTFLSAKKIDTDYYKAQKFTLLNLTSKDTLFFKSAFKGGVNTQEDYNLDFFYTFNDAGKSVLGFEESSFEFKENKWTINPTKTHANKVVFDVNTNDFDFNSFNLISGKQQLQFSGLIKGEDTKALKGNFKNVKLQSFLPQIDSLNLKGELSGDIDFIQNKNSYTPKANLFIKDFEVNDFKQGNLALNIKGNNSYKIYDVDLTIENKNVKSIAAEGDLDFSGKRPVIDLNVFLEEFKLDAFSPLGKDVLSSLRGSATGGFTLRGYLSNPDMDGTLVLQDAGLMFPYLNVEYNFLGDAAITLQEQSFIIEDFNILDVKNNTKGVFKGSITHQNFKQWFLQLNISGDNLMVLDTKNTDDALYYGSVFIDGSADIFGLTDRLTIDINAKTKPNTVFVVPLKDVETIESYSLIHFKTDKTVIEERQNEIALEALKGLSLNIDLEVTKDALAQVVIDEVNGSQLSGRGSGNLQIEIDTRGKFNMYGDYLVDSGVYDFKYGGIVNKPFVIQKGGSVSWNGKPTDANLDVTAVYKAKANPGVLLENFNSNRNIEVDLVTRITGGLFSSKQELDIQLTNVDPTIANELEFVLNDNNVNEKTTQFISLLAFGAFVNPDRVDFNAAEQFTNTASNAITAAFSSLLNSADSKFKLDVGYQQGQRYNDLDRLNIDNQVDLSISTQLSDRVIINGKVGVPVGSQTQSSVVGEVKIEILLNEEGNFRGVIFNRQNEIQFTIEDQGYTQGVGLSYQVDFNTLSELLKKVKLKKAVQAKPKVDVKKDSLKKEPLPFKNFNGN